MWLFQVSANDSKTLMIEGICDISTLWNLQNTSYRSQKHASIEQWDNKLKLNSYNVQLNQFWFIIKREIHQNNFPRMWENVSYCHYSFQFIGVFVHKIKFKVEKD